MKIIEKIAHFIDYQGNEQYAKIKFNNGVFLNINVFNQNNNCTGYMMMYFHPNNRLYLDVIYCFDEFRGAGIASFLNELADYVLSYYIGYVIRGVYEPGQLSTDRINKIERSIKELDIKARKFYSRSGYEIIDYEEYCNNKEKYPYLINEDFILREDGPVTIVAKPIIIKEHHFYEANGEIYHINYDKIDKRSRKKIIKIS